MKEPSIEDSIKILKGLKPYYEEHHKVRFTAEALRSAVELSAKYIGDRKLPDKAIDIIDEVGAAQMLVAPSKRRKTIGVKEVEQIVAKVARIPAKSVSTDDKTVLKNLERDLKTVVFGQDEAITSLTTAIKLSRAGLREPENQSGTIFFRSDRCWQDRGGAPVGERARYRVDPFRYVGIYGTSQRFPSDRCASGLCRL